MSQEKDYLSLGSDSTTPSSKSGLYRLWQKIKDLVASIKMGSINDDLYEPSHGTSIGYKRLFSFDLIRYKRCNVVLMVRSRHNGNGMLCLGVSTFELVNEVSKSFTFFGSKNEYEDTFFLYVSPVLDSSGAIIKYNVQLWIKFNDYNEMNVKIIYSYPNELTLSFGEWNTSLPTDLGDPTKCDFVYGRTDCMAICETEGKYSEKKAKCTYYVLRTNNYLFLTLKESNTAVGVLYLDVNDTGSKKIYINGYESSSTNYTINAGTYLLYYDGYYYQLRTDSYLPARVVESNYFYQESYDDAIGNGYYGSELALFATKKNLSPSGSTRSILTKFGLWTGITNSTTSFTGKNWQYWNDGIYEDGEKKSTKWDNKLDNDYNYQKMAKSSSNNNGGLHMIVEDGKNYVVVKSQKISSSYTEIWASYLDCFCTDKSSGNDLKISDISLFAYSNGRQGIFNHINYSFPPQSDNDVALLFPKTGTNKTPKVYGKSISLEDHGHGFINKDGAIPSGTSTSSGLVVSEGDGIVVTSNGDGGKIYQSRAKFNGDDKSYFSGGGHFISFDDAGLISKDPNTPTTLKVWYGTLSQYNAITTKDSNTEYHIYA